MKKILLLLVCCVLSSMYALSRDFEYTYEGQTIKYTVIDEDAKICKTKDGYVNYTYIWYAGNDVSGDLVLPGKPKDGDVEYTLTTIGDKAFHRCRRLTSIVIPNTVTSIEPYAFTECSGLTSVVIPSSVISIGKDSFSACKGLKSVTFGRSIEEIDEFAFYGCDQITSILVPPSVKKVGNGAFFGCRGLIKSAYPSELESNPFYELGYGVPGIAIKYDRNGAIVEGGIVYGADKKVIYYAPRSLKGEFAIPPTVTKIGDNAFYDCFNLTSLKIPNSLTEIGEDGFKWCGGIEKVEFESLESMCRIKYGNTQSVPTVRAHDLWINGQEVKELKLPDSFTSIGDYVFCGCSGLTSVVIPKSVTSIGDYAFYGCSGLTSVEIPNLITSIGEAVFSGCSGLTSVDIPNLVTSIGRSAFAGCSGLTSVEIPNPVTSIGLNAFNSCKNLESIVLGANLNFIGGGAFNYCNNLIDIECRSEVPPIVGNYIFESYTYNKGTLRVPKNSLSIYEATNPWRNFSEIVESDYNAVDMISGDSADGIDYRQPYEVYNLNGVKVGDSKDGLAKDIYVVRQGNIVVKISVR